MWKTYLEPLKAAGIRLGSPATTSSPTGKVWLQDFLTACAGGCTVDYVVLRTSQYCWSQTPFSSPYNVCRLVWQHRKRVYYLPRGLLQYLSTSNLGDRVFLPEFRKFLLPFTSSRVNQSTSGVGWRSTMHIRRDCTVYEHNSNLHGPDGLGRAICVVRSHGGVACGSQ
jgi:hypothetical protein